MNFKTNIHQQFVALTNAKIATLQSTLDDLTIASQNESKSTAGDKHETALAMLQIEQVQVQNQLDDFLAQKNVLDRLDITLVNDTIIPGSLIKTNKGYFYLSVAAGKIIIDDVKIFAMSTNSPLGSKMLGAKVGDNIAQNEFVYVVESFE
jgi:hypothetical protein